MPRPVPDAVLLGLIKAHSSHGYDLLERFRAHQHLGRMWHLSTSQLYSVLKRLEEMGAIQGVDVAVADAPPRREFTILPAGEAQLEKWLSEENPSASLHQIRVVFMSRLYIARLLNQPVENIFQKQIGVCETQRQEFVAEQMKTEAPIEHLALDLVINQLSAVIKWLEKNQKALSEIDQISEKGIENE